MPGIAASLFGKNGGLYLKSGDLKLPVTQFTSNLAVNEIPTAFCAIGLGRQMSSDLFKKEEIDRVSDLLPKLRMMNMAEVIFTPEGQSSPGKPWKNKGKSVVLFEGRIAGVAPSHASGKIQLGVSLVHWLFDLTSSSALVGNLHPDNSSDLAQAAVLSLGNVTGLANGSLISALAGGIVLTEALQSDWWKGVKTILTRLARLEPTAIRPAIIGLPVEPGRRNQRALDALRRFEGPVAAVNFGVNQNNQQSEKEQKEDSKPYKNAVPLPLNVGDGVINETVSLAIAQVIGSETLQGYADATLWTKLLSLCSTHGLAVAPRIKDAFVFAENRLFSPPKEKLKIVRYNMGLDIRQHRDRPLRAVVIRSNLPSQTGLAVKMDEVLNVFFGGSYVAPGLEDGAILYTTPPMWLTQLGIGGRVSDANKNHVPIVHAESARHLCNKWAHYVYAATTLRGCSGVVNTKLRFDVAPGSIVLLSRTRDPMVSSTEASLNTSLVAYVVRVITSISADPPAAFTSYQVTDVRTPEEMEMPSLTLSEHPLFSKAIHGEGSHSAPLIDDLDGD